jgi:hypothetical protein
MRNTPEYNRNENKAYNITVTKATHNTKYAYYDKLEPDICLQHKYS